MSADAIKALAGLDAARRAGWARYYAVKDERDELEVLLADTANELAAAHREHATAVGVLLGLLTWLGVDEELRVELGVMAGGALPRLEWQADAVFDAFDRVIARLEAGR
jgi:hypothetical protein